MPAKRKNLNIQGPNLWYLVGLITTDGSLSIDGRHIDITSSDYKFLQGIKKLMQINSKIGLKYGIKRYKSFRLQIANKNFYNFLLSIGLVPNKSSTLMRVKIPKKYFVDFLRGLIDGDGSIRRWIHPHNNREQWSLRIYSGSEKFIKWLNDSIESLCRSKGRIHRDGQFLWLLKYGKLAAREVLKRCYYQRAFCLKRKANLAKECINSSWGWKRSKTVLS